MNKVEKIKAYLENRRKELEDIKNRNEWTTAELGDLSCCKQTLSFIDSLEEEPVSNDLDSFAKEYSFNIPSDIYNLLPKEKQSSWIIEIENAVKVGAQWQKKQMIDKACEWLKSYRQDTPDGTGYIPGIINDETIEDFKQSMKE